MAGHSHSPAGQSAQPLLSPDGRWRWDGNAWLPNAPIPPVPVTPAMQAPGNGSWTDPGSFWSLFAVTAPLFAVGMTLFNALFSGDFAGNIGASFLMPGLPSGIMFGIAMGALMRRHTVFLPGARADAVASKLLRKGYRPFAQASGMTVYRPNSGLPMVKDQTQVYVIPRESSVEVTGPRLIVAKLV